MNLSGNKHYHKGTSLSLSSSLSLSCQLILVAYYTQSRFLLITAGQACESGWQKVGRSCLKVYRYAGNLSDCSEFCITRGAIVAAPHHRAEYLFFSNTITDLGSGMDILIGMMYSSKTKQWHLDNGIPNPYGTILTAETKMSSYMCSIMRQNHMIYAEPCWKKAQLVVCRKCVPHYSTTVMCSKRCATCAEHDKCMPGYKQPTCQKHCDPGTYGQDCALRCSNQCRSSGLCDHINGSCLDGCKDGYTPPTCSFTCGENRWGPDCQANCSSQCFISGKCDPVGGTCVKGCKVGYLGDWCNETCNDGFFGARCEEECSYCVRRKSQEERTCSHTFGVCYLHCSPGKKGRCLPSPEPDLIVGWPPDQLLIGLLVTVCLHVLMMVGRKMCKKHIARKKDRERKGDRDKSKEDRKEIKKENKGREVKEDEDK